MKNKLFVAITFSSLMLSVHSASRWNAFFNAFKSPYWSTFNKARVTKQIELIDDKDEQKKRPVTKKPLRVSQSLQQHNQRPVVFSHAENNSNWTERLSVWWKSWFSPKQ